MSNYGYNSGTYASAYNSPYSITQADPYGATPADPYGAADPYATIKSDPYGDPYAAPARADPYAAPARADPYAASDPYAAPVRADPYAAPRYSGGSLLSGDIDGKPMARAPASYNYSSPRTPSRGSRGGRGRAPIVLQEDMDAEAAAETDGGYGSSFSRPPAIGRGSPLMNHSRTVIKRPAADGSMTTAKYSRGMSGARGMGYSPTRGRGRGSSDSFGSRGSRGGGRGGSDSFRGRGGARGRGTSTFGSFNKPAVKPTKTVAGSHPAQGVALSFPGHTYEVVTHNNTAGVLNRYLVALRVGPEFDNRVYVGAGMTEKVAKHEASYTALTSLAIPGHERMTDHVIDSVRAELLEIRKMRSSPIPKMTLDGVEVDVVQYVTKEYGPDAKFEEPEVLAKGKISLFKATLTVRSQTFTEVGLTKKKAKELAALTCIKAFESHPPPWKGNDEDETTEQGVPESFQDKLVAMVYDTLKESIKDIPRDYIRMRNVAGIIIQLGQDENLEKCEVVAVATGTTTMGGHMLKEDGTAVHDCNAETLAIRAFRTYLYDQLDKAIDKKVSILQNVKKNVFKLKPGYKVIMAKNNPPIGDAIAIPQPSGPARDNYRNRNSINVQTDSPGALQFVNCPRKRDGAQAQRFNTEVFLAEKNIKKPVIACPSDKLTVRNIAGVQGALLSQFLQPIYIEKYLFHKSALVSLDALKRSFYERIESQIYKVPPPYKIAKPEFQTYRMKVVSGKMLDKYAGWMTSKPQRDWEVIKMPEGASITEFSIVEPIRHKCESEVEYYEKKLENAKKVVASMRTSQLSKRSLFEQYKWVNQKLNREIPDTYFACKALASEYHTIKLSVNNAFTNANLGTWPVKDINTENFQL